MRALLILLCGFAVIDAAYASTDDFHPIQVQVAWRITINPQGRVTAMAALPNKRLDRTPQIRTRIEQAVRTWKFLPGLVDGKPAETQSGLYLRATLTPTSDTTISIRFDHANVGPLESRMVPPRYPPDAIRHRKTGQVVLVVAYDTQGRVSSMKTAEGLPKVDATLIDAAEKATSQLKFEPEMVGGHALAGRAILPYCFTLQARGSRHIEGKCDWKPHDNKAAFRNGEYVALNPAAKLLTDISGQTL